METVEDPNQIKDSKFYLVSKSGVKVPFLTIASKSIPADIDPYLKLIIQAIIAAITLEVQTVPDNQFDNATFKLENFEQFKATVYTFEQLLLARYEAATTSSERGDEIMWIQIFKIETSEIDSTASLILDAYENQIKLAKIKCNKNLRGLSKLQENYEKIVSSLIQSKLDWLNLAQQRVLALIKHYKGWAIFDFKENIEAENEGNNSNLETHEKLLFDDASNSRTEKNILPNSDSIPSIVSCHSQSQIGVE